MNFKFLFFAIALLLYSGFAGMAESTSLSVPARFLAGQRRFNEHVSKINNSSISDMASASSEYLVALRDLKSDPSLDAGSTDAVDQEITRFMSERDVSELNLASRSDKLSIVQVGYIEKTGNLKVGQKAALAEALIQYVSFLEELASSADDTVPTSVLADINKELQRIQNQISRDPSGAAAPPKKAPVAGVVSARSDPADGVIADDVGIIGRIFHGRVLKFNPASCEISLVYDFSDPDQKEDWELAKWADSTDRGEWDVVNGAVQLNRLPVPLLHKAVFRDVSIVAGFHVAGTDDSAGVIIGATQKGDFYCMMGLERGKHSILRKYEKGSRAGTLSKVHDSPFRVYGKGKVGLAISGKSIYGEVGLGRFRGDAENWGRGQVGVFAPGSNVRFDSLRITGVLDERWYRAEKRRAERVAQ